MRVAVVGLGAAGSAALRFVAQAGHQAVGFEQFRIGHTRGSSHGESRIYRLTYPDPFYTRLMREALPLWHALEQAAGEELMVRCGVLWLGKENDAELQQIMQSLQQENAPFEILTPADIERRFPAIRLYSGECALFQADGGFLRASACVQANIRLAVQAGAQLREQTRVQGLEPAGACIALHLSDGTTERFDRVILTAGAWLPKLLPQLSLPLTVTRQVYAYFALRQHAERFDPTRLPVWIEAGTHFYGFPADGRQAGIKIAQHMLGEIHDPDHEAHPADERDLQPLREWIRFRLPDLDETVLYAATCLYTNTPDEHFLMAHLPGEPRVWYLSACSGHGFKFSILMGKRVAEAAIHS
ncbi:MAG: N-methyl-L-tryptophan oxidase [Armatimonadota bacterium]